MAKKIEGEQQFFGEWWKLLQKYGFPPSKDNRTKEADTFWYSLVADARALHKRYEKNEIEPFILSQCTALINEIERRAELAERCNEHIKQ